MIWSSRLPFMMCIVLVAAMMTTLTGCPEPDGPAPIGDDPIKVVVTTSIIADTVKHIGTDRVNVIALMGPDTDPHTYIPSPTDATSLSQAQIVFHNGLHLEGKMTDRFEKSTGGPMIVAVSKMIPEDKLRIVDGNHDPHIWFDVNLWKLCAVQIRDSMIELDPTHEQHYRSNCDAYLQELTELDGTIRKEIQTIPEQNRVLITSHDAFGYFGQAYGVEVHGLQGISTAAAAGTRDVDDLVQFLDQRRIPAVFCETSVLPKGLKKVIETVESEYNTKITLVDGKDALYSDALGGPGSNAETYTDMVMHNVQSLVKHLKP